MVKRNPGWLILAPRRKIEAARCRRVIFAAGLLLALLSACVPADLSPTVTIPVTGTTTQATVPETAAPTARAATQTPVPTGLRFIEFSSPL